MAAKIITAILVVALAVLAVISGINWSVALTIVFAVAALLVLIVGIVLIRRKSNAK